MGLKLSSAIGFAECGGFFVGCHWMEEYSLLKWRYLLVRNMGYRTAIVSEVVKEINSGSRLWYVNHTRTKGNLFNLVI